MLKTALRAVLGLPIAYIIASIGAFYVWPEHMTKPSLLYEAWQHYRIDIPKPVFYSTMLGIFSYFLMVFYQKAEQEKYGTAKWGTWKTALALSLNGKTGVFMGFLKHKGKKKPLILDESLSTLILAPPGTGKTTGIAIPTLLTSTNSFMVTDPKGELFEITAPTRSKISRILYFSPTDPRSCTFNPLAENMLPENVLDINGHVQNIANIVIPTGKKGEDYFTQAGRAAFGFFAKWLIWKNGKTSISEIRSQLLSSSDIVNTIEEMLDDLEDEEIIPKINKNKTYENNAEQVKDKIKENGRATLIAAKGQDQWAGVMGTLSVALEPYGDDRISKATSGVSDICAHDFKKDCITAYLVIPDKDMKALSPIITLIFEVIGSQLISKMPEKNQTPITFMLDEFVRLGKLETIAELPAISRGYRVNVVFIAQDFKQIAAKYGHEQAEIFYSTTAFKVIFRQNNYETAEKLSKLIGKRTTTRESINKDHKKLFKKESGSSLSEEGIELVTAQDILNLEKNDSLIVGQGEIKHPIKAINGFWYENKEFIQMVENNSFRLKVLLPEA